MHSLYNNFSNNTRVIFTLHSPHTLTPLPVECKVTYAHAIHSYCVATVMTFRASVLDV